MQGVVRQRPLGITIIAIIIAVGAILAFIGAIVGLVLASSSTHNAAFGTTAVTGIVILGIFTLLELFIAWGLWTLKRWAFWIAVIVEAINVLFELYLWLIAGISFTSVALSLIVGIVILVYLFADRNVRAAFRV